MLVVQRRMSPQFKLVLGVVFVVLALYSVLTLANGDRITCYKPDTGAVIKWDGPRCPAGWSRVR